MTMQNNTRRRPRTSPCSVASTRRRVGSMGIKAAVTLLALLHSPTSLPTNAFTQPISNVRRISQHSHSFTQILYTSNNHEVDLNSPIRTNQILSRLTQEEEVTLLQTMRAHPSHTPISQKARQTLLLHNLPLVQSIVTKILRSRPHLLKNNKGGNKGNSDKVGAALSKDDLLHEGTIGLAEAIDRYDLAYAQTSKDSSLKKKMMTKTNSITHPGIKTPSTPIIPRGARLGTYATYWIRARIIRAIQSREHVFRFPEHVLQASHRLVKATEKMGLKWHVVTELADYDVITVAQMKLRDELCVVAGIKSDGLFREAVRVRTMSQVGSTTPLESWMIPSSSLATTSGRSIFDDQISLEEEGGGQEHIVETLSKFLVPREVEVLSLRYGLVSADEDGESSEQPQQQVFRDYEAEAEEDLFGPNGVLSHYSETAAESIAAVASTSKSTKSEAVASTSSTQTPRKVKMMTSASNTLLPFKEIGKRMQFSGEYCRRTCSVALDKLTRAVEEGRLAESDFLLGFS